MAREEHKHIYLQPICGEVETEGRQWCQDDVWGGACDDCKAPSVKFIRADLVEETLAAERKWHEVQLAAIKGELNGMALIGVKPMWGSLIGRLEQMIADAKARARARARG